MGCHTWLYKHIPERQEEFKKKIIDQTIAWANYMVESVYNNPERAKENHEDYIGFLRDCDQFIDDWKDASIEEILKCFSSEDKFHYHYDFANTARAWTYKQFIDWCIAETIKEANLCKDNIIPESGSFYIDADEFDPENICDYASHLYSVRDGKIYVHGLIAHGDDIGRIYDYEQPDCLTAEETIDCFKKHEEYCDEELIKKLFSKNDMFVEFG